MRKSAILFLCLISAFLFCSCGKNEEVKNKNDVVINLPVDNSVNGYRTDKKDDFDDSIISADDVGIDSGTSQNSSQSKNESGSAQTNKNESTNENTKGITYCGNKNSGVFHEENCSSVSKMKEENKAYFSSRDEAISNGYTPCGRCKP